DNDGELDLVVVSPVEFSKRDSFTGPDQRAASFEEKTHLMNNGCMRFVVVMKRSIALHFVQMLLIIDGSADDFTGVRHWTQKPQPRYRQRWRIRRECARSLQDRVEIGNENVVGRKRITIRRQYIQRCSDIPDIGAFNETEPFIAKPAKPHRCSYTETYVNNHRDTEGTKKTYFLCALCVSVVIDSITDLLPLG